MQRPGVELATSRSQARRPTEPACDFGGYKVILYELQSTTNLKYRLYQQAISVMFLSL